MYMYIYIYIYIYTYVYTASWAKRGNRVRDYRFLRGFPEAAPVVSVLEPKQPSGVMGKIQVSIYIKPHCIKALKS